jgi:hypothetical protein
LNKPTPTGPQPRSGRDLFMVPVADRLNDQFRFIDTMILSMSDSWSYLPPRAKHILWLKLASAEMSFLEQVGMPMENGILIHWGMWPDDLGDYAQAVAMRMSRQQLEYLEPKNVAMASAIRQAELAEATAKLQINLAQQLIQLTQMGAKPETLSQLFSKNKHDKESLSTVLSSAEQEIERRKEEMLIHQQRVQQEKQRAAIEAEKQRQLLAERSMDEEEGDGILRATPQDLPVGLCPYCGIVKPYVLGEDEEGQYLIESCIDCLPESSMTETLDAESIIQSLDPVMSDEELLFIADTASQEE